MSARFAELMALSASHTRQADVNAQSLLIERRKKEEKKRKEQEEKDRKEREQHVRLVKLRLEEEKRERERKEKAEEERRRKEQLLAKKEAEQRDALLHGPKAGSRSNWGSRDSNRGAHRARDDDDALDAGAAALTREEKRQRKLQVDLNRNFTSKRPSHAGSSKANRAFRGATIISSSTNPLELSNPANNHLSVKERLAAMPMVLTRLNTVKRDTRTIDEIVRDRQKAREAKVLDGEDARGFNDWFGKAKKADTSPKKGSTHSSASPPPSRAVTPVVPPPKQSTSGHDIPTQAPSSNTLSSRSSSVIPQKGTVRKQLSKPAPERDTKAVASPSRPQTKPPTNASKASVKASKSNLPASSLRSSNLPPLNSGGKKRGRSSSSSDSPPPPKRKTPSSAARNDISSEIWKLFGKDRDRYVNNDVYSDEDDDMEADADAVRREELRSARLAKKEDELAEEEERRHEETKRRRRKERELRERCG